MIVVTRLDGSSALLNIDLIVTIEQTPDTMLSLTTGDMMLVRESPEELVERITRFKRGVERAAELVTPREGSDGR
jgi:flagellar protein FlbD